MTPPDDHEPADPGLARARTGLAWTRTAIAFAALGGAVLKSRPVPGIVILALSALIWGLGRVAGSAPAGERARARRLLLITVAVTAVSLAALVLSLFSSGPAILR
jgi:uncharacterized membrane protein YidH (DUF202 family)